MKSPLSFSLKIEATAANWEPASSFILGFKIYLITSRLTLFRNSIKVLIILFFNSVTAFGLNLSYSVI